MVFGNNLIMGTPFAMPEIQRAVAFYFYDS